jgi:hypothetical protein
MKRFSLCLLLPLAGLLGLPTSGCSDPAEETSDAGDAGRDALPDHRNERETAADPVCEPHDVTGYTPSAGKRTTKHEACPDSWIDQFLEDCFGDNASNATCGNWVGTSADQAHQDCGACMLTQDTAATYGAVISSSVGFVVANVPGCMEVLDSAAAACADKNQALIGCEATACAAGWCPVPVQSSDDLTEWNQCAQSAASDGCGTYAQDYQTCLASVSQDAKTKCDPANDFIGSAKAVGKIICGGGALPDGGTDDGGGDGG